MFSNLYRTITKKVYGGDNPKHVGAQQLMQGNIAVKFEGAWPYDS